MIFPSPEIKTLKEMVDHLSRKQIESSLVYECLSYYVTGVDFWSIWQSYPEDKEEEKIKYLQLFTISKQKTGWGYTQYSKEEDFKSLCCPIPFLTKTQNSPFINEEWRAKVKQRFAEKTPKDWEQCKKLFHKLSEKNTGEKIRIYFKGLMSKRGESSEVIPYADLESLFPLIGRYKNELYELKKRAIVGYEVLEAPKHPKGLKNGK